MSVTKRSTHKQKTAQPSAAKPACADNTWDGHDTDKPVCRCGYKWAYVATYSNGDKLYWDQAFLDRFRALYGDPKVKLEALR